MSSWKSHKCATLCAAALGLVDISLTTVTFGHGNQIKEQFLVDVYQYDFSTSMFELWVFGLCRTAILMGGIIGFVCQAKVAVERINASSPIVTTVLILMWTYTLTKLLLYSEAVPDLNKPWFWTLFAWTQLSVLLTYITWSTLANLEISNAESCDLTVNTSDEERQPLLHKRQHNVKGDKSSNEDGSKKEGEEKSKGSLKTAWRLLKYSKPDWYIVLTAFIFLSASSVSEVFLPFYTGSVIDGIAIKRSKSLFVRAIIIMSALSIGSSFAAGIRGGCFKVAIARLQMRVCNHFFSALMKHEVAFYDETRTGEITSRLTSDTTTMSQGLSLNVNIFLRSLLQAVGTAVFMFQLSWQLSMVTVMGMPIIMVVSELYGKYYKELSKKVQDTLAKANEVAEEACSSMRTVRSFANETAEADRYASRLIDTYKLKVKEALAYSGYMWSTDLFSLSLVVATLYYGGHLVVSDRLTGGHLVSFILYQMQLGYCIESIAGVYTAVMQAVGASEKVFEFMDRKPQIKHEGQLKPTKFSGALQFRNITFTYPSRPDAPVLKNVSFHVKPGEVVALVGPSGGGKSTCVNLIEHFYETTSGQVLLDNIPIEQYDHKYLHSKLALVGQEPVLYARTIRENIAYGMEDVDMDLVRKAARQANAHEFISELKDQYETQAGEKGAQLSGGQKQRVAIARALIRNPAILLLDEATSALDSESEHIVQQAVYNNLKGHTVLIVAHRLSTVEKANRIIVINKGEVAEEGTHKDLLEYGGLYAQLVQRQLLSFNASPVEDPTPRGSQSPSLLSTSNTSFKSIDSHGSDMAGPAVLKASVLSRSPVFGSL